jgi:hypothetical protein
MISRVRFTVSIVAMCVIIAACLTNAYAQRIDRSSLPLPDTQYK